MTRPTVVVLVTGHPATGKTTLAHNLAQSLHLPLIWKDQIKESLLDTLGTSTVEWSRKLGVATWALLYLQVENLLRANISHIVESNFDPTFADEKWQRLVQLYDFHLIQVRCETEPEVLLARYIQRIEEGNRHPGHVDGRQDEEFLASIQKQRGWIKIDSDQLSVNTTEVGRINYADIGQEIRNLMPKGLD